jgi:hypothetical protein
MLEYTSEPEDGEDSIPLPPLAFTLDGVEFRALEEATGDALLSWSELGLAASDEVDIDTPEGVSFMARFLRATFDPAEYQRLRRHIRSHKTHPAVVMRIVSDLQAAMAEGVEAATDRPTVPSSPSSSGAAVRDAPPARVVSLSRGLVEWADEAEAKRMAAEAAAADHEEALTATAPGLAKPRAKAKQSKPKAAAGGAG